MAGGCFFCNVLTLNSFCQLFEGCVERIEQIEEEGDRHICGASFQSADVLLGGM